jgi:hypothetical protein
VFEMKKTGAAYYYKSMRILLALITLFSEAAVEGGTSEDQHDDRQ